MLVWERQGKELLEDPSIPSLSLDSQLHWSVLTSPVGSNARQWVKGVSVGAFSSN